MQAVASRWNIKGGCPSLGGFFERILGKRIFGKYAGWSKAHLHKR